MQELVKQNCNCNYEGKREEKRILSASRSFETMENSGEPDDPNKELV